MIDILNEIDVMPIITLVLQLCAISFFTVYMIGFTIKKLFQLMK